MMPPSLVLVKFNTKTKEVTYIVSALSFAIIRNYLSDHNAVHSHDVVTPDNSDDPEYSVFISKDEPGIEYRVHVTDVMA